MISFELPLRLVSEANSRSHRFAKARRVKSQREVVTLGLRTRVRSKPTLPAVVTLTRIAPRRLDDDNAVSSQKAIRDSIAAWLGIDDRSPLVTWRYAQEQGRPKTYAVRIEITPATAEGETR